ncbi:DUF928 domain-containing protein [Desulfococcaceae bacterium HSG8]|nr:DUF928 domain-containing protein [Desulfococcaceae bacterium HSG8]
MTQEENDETAQVANHEEEENQASEGDAHGHGGDAPMPSMMAPLASLQTGYTANNQPALWWYISGPWPGKIEVTLNEYGKIDPVLETHIDGPDKEGIYQISLADYNVTLEPDVEYEWFMVIVPAPKERSADFLGSATIKYVRPSENITERTSGMSGSELYYEYAKEGYWYDAIETLCRQIDENPEDKKLISHRVGLLEQIRMGKVIDYDKKRL